MYQVLHITTHMGGGIGKVLSGITAYTEQFPNGYKHRILLLEAPEKMNFIDFCKNNGGRVEVAESLLHIKNAIERSDIVQIEWWHHPLMAKFLAEFPKVPTRLFVWSHISGTYYPWLPVSFIDIPEMFLFTSPYSIENPYWTERERAKAAAKCRVVYSSGGFENIRAEDMEHDGFNIGYIGTQSYAKMHPDFVRYCRQIADIPNLYFTMVGDKTNQVQILQAAKELGIERQFHFIDYVDDVSQEFSKMDVFGYLLNPSHFGTTENVLLEAMAARVPVICLEQGTEKYLIQDRVTGLLVRNEKEYGEAVRFLYEHPEERQRLGRNARKMVLDKFSVKNTVGNLERIYEETLEKEKNVYDFSAIFGDKPYQYFLACLPKEVKLVFEKLLVDETESLDPQQLPVILLEHSKSSIQHFARTYPEDAILQKWAGMITNEKY